MVLDRTHFYHCFCTHLNPLAGWEPQTPLCCIDPSTEDRCDTTIKHYIITLHYRQTTHETTNTCNYIRNKTNIISLTSFASMSIITAIASCASSSSWQYNTMNTCTTGNQQTKHDTWITDKQQAINMNYQQCLLSAVLQMHHHHLRTTSWKLSRILCTTTATCIWVRWRIHLCRDLEEKHKKQQQQH